MPRGRDSSSYLPHEWQESRDFHRVMVRKVLPGLPHLTVQLSWSSLMEKNPQVTTTTDEATTMAQNLPLMTHDCVICSEHGTPLLFFMRKGISRSWKPNQQQQLHDQTRAAIDDLQKMYAAPLPKVHRRHQNQSHQNQHTAYEVYHFALVTRLVEAGSDDNNYSLNRKYGGVVDT